MSANSQRRLAQAPSRSRDGIVVHQKRQDVRQNWHRMLLFQHKREDVPGTAAAIFDHHNVPQARAGSRGIKQLGTLQG